ncbi:hypothetical protein PUNSTDRAFT_139611 [Punctularia strigosozonata HHB-11173 SS5]|uniref:Fucose-specific lectin n=1 Tax=Punctularia strigosozonata (strain HHB-11173) TaxID=741275 RepID=R7RZF8_PUNST|nr:uncharacterized protein PUNSTDRAFT_139611 [Punctularia strigosozonata HHB-11173 SS5]EIN03373.1 hypothetical protein PUNSTDRAFT_139611 [Punctularia strigosozonata HHB-11173 SS5]
MFNNVGDGAITSAQNDLLNADIGAAMQTPSTPSRQAIIAQAQGWYTNDFAQSCAPQSRLRAFAAAAGPISLFYETLTHQIVEMRSDNGWANTGFLQDNVLPGTEMAEMHSPGGYLAILFFQDKQGYICYRKASGVVWDDETQATCNGSIVVPYTLCKPPRGGMMQ